MFIQAKSQKRSFKLLSLAGLCLLIVALLFAGNNQSASARSNADTSVGGTISVDTHWTTADSPYIVTSDLTINAGITLTIDAGVEVRNSGMVGIIVNGTLVATGNSGAHVIFTSAAGTPVPGDWKGIYVPDGGTANLDYTEIRYGGGYFYIHPNWGNHYGNLRKDATGTLTIANSLITQSADCGLRFDTSSGVNSVSNTTFSNNQAYGACLNGATTNTITFMNSIFTGNLPQAIITSPHSSGFSIDSTNVLDKAIYVTGGGIDVDSTWSPQVYLLEEVTLLSGNTLAIPAGAVVKFNGMTSLVVYGTLDANGVDGSHVVFTSLLDDTGGDTNGDGTASTPIPGDWKGIYVPDAGNASLEYTEIRYGGGEFYSGGWGRFYGNLRKDGTGTLTLTNSLATQSAGSGLLIFGSSSTVNISDSYITNNSYWGMEMSSSGSNLLVEGSLIDHNAAGGISLSNPGATVHVYSSTIVANTGVGIWLGNETPAVIGGTDANGNNIYGNSTLQLQNVSTLSIDASNNWWGINPPIYSEIAGNVDTSSPLSAPAINAPAYLADIAISGTGLPGTGLIGEVITYSLLIENNGPREAYYVKVSATLPVGVTLTGFNGTDWTCNQVDQQLTCVLNYLAFEAESALEISIAAVQPVHLAFDFIVSQANNDVLPANNVLSIDTQVNTRVFLPLIQR